MDAKPQCIGICLTAAEIGVEGNGVRPGDIAIAHPDCELHSPADEDTND